MNVSPCKPQFNIALTFHQKSWFQQLYTNKRMSINTNTESWHLTVYQSCLPVCKAGRHRLYKVHIFSSLRRMRTMIHTTVFFPWEMVHSVVGWWWGAWQRRRWVEDDLYILYLLGRCGVYTETQRLVSGYRGIRILNQSHHYSFRWWTCMIERRT